MRKPLVIVESDSKRDTLERYIDADFRVIPSDFPNCVQENPDQLDTSFSGKDNSNIFIATDPDLRGELLAFQVMQHNNVPQKVYKRLFLHANTKESVKNALNQPTLVNSNLIKVEKARSELNQYFTEKLHSCLNSDLPDSFEFGFLQANILSTVYTLEQEITNHCPSESYDIIITFKTKSGKTLNAKLCNKEIPTLHHAKALIIALKQCEFKVESIDSQTKKQKPPPPYNTLMLFEDAWKHYTFPPEKTLRLAKELYDGIIIGKNKRTGLITFPITRNTLISEDEILTVRELIFTDYGKLYLPRKPIQHGSFDKNNKLCGIYPTIIRKTPSKLKKYLDQDQLKLYSLIWHRYIASQMKPAVIEANMVTITSEMYSLTAFWQDIKFRGYLQVFEDITLPTKSFQVQVGEKLHVKQITYRATANKSRQRYTMIDLLKKVDSISNLDYLQSLKIVDKLLHNNLIILDEGQVIPTHLGEIVTNLIKARMPALISDAFIREFEEQLFKIGKNKKKYNTVISNFVKLLESGIDDTDKSGREGGMCPVCKSPLIVVKGREGKYKACVLYPEKCTFAKPYGDQKVLKCSKCGKNMILREGPYGRFWSCSGFPRCRSTRPYYIDVLCPKEGCDGQVIERQSKHGHTFYGCTRYPECNFSSWKKPLNIACPACGHIYMLEKSFSSVDTSIQCPKCKKVFDVELNPLEE